MATFTGTSGNDTITGTTVSAGVTRNPAGSVPSTLADSIDGGSGNDSLDASGGNDTVNGGSGNDTVVGGAGNDVLDGGTYADYGNDSLSGGAGNDTLYGLEADTLDGGDGNDLLLWANGDATQMVLKGGAGTDTLKITNVYAQLAGFSKAATGIEIIDGSGWSLDGTSGNDVFDFTGVSLVNIPAINGGDGNDSITGFGASASVNGGNGNDTVVGGSGNDVLDGGTYADYGNDSLSGGAGNDTLYGLEADTLDGGDGNDLLLWANGDATQMVLKGGAGTDTLKITNVYAQLAGFSKAATGIEIIDGSGWSLDGTSGNDVFDFTGVSLVNIPAINGGDGNDSITGFGASASVNGGNGNDTVVGGAGNDVLDGGTYADYGNDSLSGGAGNDTLYGLEADTLDGGDGNDLLLWANGDATQMVLKGGAGTDTLKITNVYAQLAGFSKAATGIEIIDGSGWSLDGTSGNDVFDFTGVSLVNIPAINGGDGNDSITGFGASASVNGGNGNDTVVGGSGNDVLDGGTYADYGNDSLSGGAGNDTLYGLEADTLDGGDGNDLLLWANGDATQMVLKGGAGTDTLKITNVYAQLAGFSKAATGIEIIDGSGWSLDGTSGNDVFDFTGVSLVNIPLIDGGSGNDSIIGSADGDTITGGYGNDTLIGGAGDDFIYAGSGDDSYAGGDGVDTIDFRYNSSPMTFNMTAGTALFSDGSVEAMPGFENLYGGGGNDSIAGTTGANRLWGEGGNDTILGNGGNDTLSGGSGTDSLNGGAGIDTIDYSYATAALTVNLVTQTASGGESETFAGFENAIGGQGNDSLLGTGAANALDGQGGNDTINAGGGDDTVCGGLGNDSLIGGAGINTLDYSYSTAAGSINLATGITDLGTDDDSFSGFVHVIAGAGANTITGSADANLLDGGAGNDSIVGGTGADTLIGNLGDDTLDGGTDADSLAGGAGNDTYVVNIAGDVVSEDAGAGRDLVRAAVSYTLGDNVEQLTLTGTAAINGTGNVLANLITGNAGANVLGGLDGNDTLRGVAGNDSLDGGAGNDSLDGGTGSDTMTGGAGNDTFVVDAAGDVVTEAAGGGTDLMLSSVTRTLAANVENLTLTGTANINGTGNGLANLITGNTGNNVLNGAGGADTLIGGGGDDTLIGGAGADSFVFGGANGNVSINDFTDTGAASDDVIRIVGYGTPLDSFADLDISYGGGNAVINLSADVAGAGVITLVGVTNGLDASDFLFV